MSMVSRNPIFILEDHMKLAEPRNETKVIYNGTDSGFSNLVRLRENEGWKLRKYVKEVNIGDEGIWGLMTRPLVVGGEEWRDRLVPPCPSCGATVDLRTERPDKHESGCPFENGGDPA